MKPNTYTLSLSIGQALQNYVVYKTSVPELVSEISKENPGLSIEVLDNQANEIALERVTRRVRHVDMDLVREVE